MLRHVLFVLLHVRFIADMEELQNVKNAFLPILPSRFASEFLPVCEAKPNERTGSTPQRACYRVFDRLSFGVLSISFVLEHSETSRNRRKTQKRNSNYTIHHLLIRVFQQRNHPLILRFHPPATIIPHGSAECFAYSAACGAKNPSECPLRR